MTIHEKLNHLEESLKNAGSALVAFSGGVDSTYLLAEVIRILGKKSCLAVTAVSESMAPEEFAEARELAEQLDARWTTIHTREIDIPAYQANDRDRCYHCKHHLFGLLVEKAEQEGLNVVLDGANADDVGDWRPGARASRELGVISPLMDAGFTKTDIRTLSRERNLPTADKAAQACLASRIPYGTEVTAERLKQVACAESVLRRTGFDTFRARYHDGMVRLELGSDEFEKIQNHDVREKIREDVSRCGFSRVCLDLRDFQSGNMNRRSGDGTLKVESSWNGVLRALGYDTIRVERIGEIAVLSVFEQDFPVVISPDHRSEIVHELESQGALHVAVNLELETETG